MTTTKKTAAKPEKKAEAAPSTFPLEKGRYFSVPVMARGSVSSGGYVHLLRSRLGLKPGTDFDADVAAAVAAAQEKAGLPVTHVVDAATWDAIVE